MDFAMSGSYPCDAKVSSKEDVVKDGEEDDTKGRGENGILRAQFKRGAYAMFPIVPDMAT